jgi:carbonic anhydrase
MFALLGYFLLLSFSCGRVTGITGGDDHYVTYTDGKWNYDYSQVKGNCPTCSTTDKCGPHCWDKIIDPKNQCDATEHLQQTPIDVNNYVDTPATLETEFEMITLDGQGCPDFNILADDHAFEIDFKGAATPCTALKMTWNDTEMHLEQFHTHSPSEHTINGKYADAELHMVHKKMNGNTLVKAAVLGVMLVVDPDLQVSPFTKFWELIDEAAGDPSYSGSYAYGKRYSAEWEVANADDPLNAYSEFLPEDKTFYHYTGSLTTFPCTNGIDWFLFEEPLMITKADLANLQKAVAGQDHTITMSALTNFNGDNRPIQPQGGVVYKRIDPRSTCDHAQNPFGCGVFADDAAPHHDQAENKVDGGTIAGAVLAAFFGATTICLLVYVFALRTPQKLNEVALADDENGVELAQI